MRRASEITPTTVRWLWDGRIPYAKLTALSGPPGVGKSYLTCALAGAVSNGRGLPGDPRGTARPTDVLLLTYEDDPEDTIRPRLELVDANLDRVHLIEGVTDDDQRRAFGPDDVARLVAYVERLDRVGLVVIDPVSAYVGAGTDEHRGNEVRAALEDLRIAAQDHGFAVLLVMHNRKGQADTALNRLAGSHAYGALVRSVLVAGPIIDDDDGHHALAHVKHNLAPKQPTLAYAVTDQGVAWHGEVDLDGEEIAGNTDGEQRSAVEEARGFLREELADGPRRVKDLQGEAREAGLSWRTVERAKKPAGVRSVKDANEWRWELTSPTAPAPDGTDTDAPGNTAGQHRQDPQSGGVAALAALDLDEGSEVEL